MDAPSQILFVTDVYQEAVAAKTAGKCPKQVLLVKTYPFLIPMLTIYKCIEDDRCRERSLLYFASHLFHGCLPFANQFLFDFVSGLDVMISVRPGNGPLPDSHGFKTITSFAEI